MNEEIMKEGMEVLKAAGLALEEIPIMISEDLKVAYKIAARQIGEGIEKGAWDKVEWWFGVVDTITKAPAWTRISPQEREKLAKDLRKRVFLASYEHIEPGEYVMEKILLKRDITIKGNPYKAGWYKVPEEMDEKLACWLVDKGFAEMRVSIAGCERIPEELHKINKLVEQITGIPVFLRVIGKK